MEDSPKKIEIVSGNGENLDISDVSTHISITKPKIKEEENKKEIVIPKSKEKNTKKKEN